MPPGRLSHVSTRDAMLVGLAFAGHRGFTFAHFLARRGYKVVSVLPTVTKALEKVEDNSPRKSDDKGTSSATRF